MSGRLFRLGQDERPTEIVPSRFVIERELQHLLEAHLQDFLGVRFLASEYHTGARHGGRIDTLGLDENGFPVIIEYKRETHESVINQGLYYLDWLVHSRAEFQLLVQAKLGADVAAEINWSAPRLICVAGDFTRYDRYAVQQINRHIELVKYLRYGDDLIMLELTNTPVRVATTSGTVSSTPAATTGGAADPPAIAAGDASVQPTPVPAAPENVEAMLLKSMTATQMLFGALDSFIRGLDELAVEVKTLKLYFAYKKLRNFATVTPGKRELWLYLHLDPATVNLNPQIMRDVTAIGHWGTGNLEVTLKSEADLEEVKPLIQRAFETNA